jgi:hypothetical protein
MPRARFLRRAFLMDFLAGYPGLPIQNSILSRPRAMAPYAARRQREKHSGEYRENSAAVNREPLHYLGYRTASR